MPYKTSSFISDALWHRSGIFISILFLICSALSAQQIDKLTPYFNDYGVIRPNTVLSDTIKFVNTGSDPFVIEKITSSCGCSDIHIGKKSIAPDDTAVIVYSIRTRGMRGVNREYIKLSLNGLEKREYNYTVQFNVIEDLEVNPRFFYLVSIPFSPDTTIRRVLHLANHSHTSVKVLRISSESDELSILPQTALIKPGESAAFKIIFKPKSAQASHWRIHLKTDFEAKPLIGVPFYVTYD